MPVSSRKIAQTKAQAEAAARRLVRSPEAFCAQRWFRQQSSHCQFVQQEAEKTFLPDPMMALNGEIEAMNQPRCSASAQPIRVVYSDADLERREWVKGQMEQIRALPYPTPAIELDEKDLGFVVPSGPAERKENSPWIRPVEWFRRQGTFQRVGKVN